MGWRASAVVIGSTRGFAMKMIRRAALSLIATLGFIIALGVTAAPANAQATRTWVSGVGDDANPCSRTAPCKTFAGAISKTATGGEINCLDPAGFGAVTITKSITIDCTGTLGGVLASSTTGVIINGAGAVVTLRALEINGGTPALPGVNGVRFLQGSTLTIEDSTIYNFLGAAPNGFGILVNPTSTTVRLVVRNTTINNNGNAANGAGIGIQPTGSASVQVNLENVRLVGNPQVGFFASNGGTGAITASLDGVTISGSTTGILATGATPVVLQVVNSTINNASTGLSASGAGARIRLGTSTLFNNGTAASASGGAIINTYGDNHVNGNGSDGTFSLPALPLT
jgi:hypothetical protein